MVYVLYLLLVGILETGALRSHALPTPYNELVYDGTTCYPMTLTHRQLGPAGTFRHGIESLGH